MFAEFALMWAVVKGTVVLPAVTQYHSLPVTQFELEQEVGLKTKAKF